MVHVVSDDWELVFMKKYLCGVDYHVASGEILVTVGLGQR